MILEHMSLARQVDFAFRQMEDELKRSDSGVVFLHIRNNSIGKFGLRQEPIDTLAGKIPNSHGLSTEQCHAFRKLAVEALKHIKWSHGELQFEFALKHHTLVTSVIMESNYNMAALVPSMRKAYS